MKAKLLATSSLLLLAATAASAQVSLSGTAYDENFNGIGSGLPTGWGVYTDANTTSLGSAASFTTSATSWGSTTGNFRNAASADGLSSGSTTTAQGNSTNRALAIRQSGSFGDPGAAFVVEIQNTTGFHDFNMNFEAQMLSVQSRSTTWVVDYRVGGSGTFTVLGEYADPNVFSSSSMATDFRLVGFGSDINNQADSVFIRVWARDDSTGGGSRDTFGISNFQLTYRDTSDTNFLTRPLGAATITYDFQGEGASSKVAKISSIGTQGCHF